jgi:hypothetical protein
MDYRTFLLEIQALKGTLRIFEIVKAVLWESLEMATRERERKLRQGNNNAKGVHRGQAAKDETLWIEKKGRAWSEIGKAETERKDRGTT